LVAACGLEDDLPVVELARRCDGRHLEVCDVLEPGCRDDYLEYVACLRDEPVSVRPAVEVITQEELERSLADGLTGEDARELDDLGSGMALLGMYSDDRPFSDAFVANRTATVPAFYSTETKRITFVSGHSVSEERAVRILAHEVSHALQDSAFDLDAGFDAVMTDDDRALAYTAVVEGDAKLYEWMVDLALDRQTVWAVDWDAFFDDATNETLATVEPSSAPLIWTPRTFPYTFGARYVVNAWMAEQHAATRGLFLHPPASSAQVLAGWGASPGPDGVWVEPLAADPVLGGTLSDYRPATEVVFGRWHLNVFLRRLGLGTASEEISAGWRADTVWVFRDVNRVETAVVWHVRWRDGDGGTLRFVEAVEAVATEHGLPWRTSMATRDAVLVAASAPGTLGAWLEVADGLLAADGKAARPAYGSVMIRKASELPSAPAVPGPASE
jgi:hypothetical protein